MHPRRPGAHHRRGQLVAENHLRSDITLHLDLGDVTENLTAYASNSELESGSTGEPETLDRAAMESGND